MTDTTAASPHDRGPAALPCGHDPLDVDDRARAGRSTEHELGCAYCQEVIAAASPAGRAAAALADTESDTPAPDTLLPGVMGTVWSELRRSRMVPLPLDAGTATAFIADHAVAALVENALDDLDDLQLHTCTVALGPHGGAEAGTEPDPAPGLAVAVTAGAAYGSDVLGLADHARDVVARMIGEQLGWDATTIDFDIVDVYLPEGAR